MIRVLILVVDMFCRQSMGHRIMSGDVESPTDKCGRDAKYANNLFL